MKPNLTGNLLPAGGRVTQAEFDRLPALLTSYQVCLLAGFNRHELAAEVKAGKIKTWWPCRVRGRRGRPRPRYLKTSVARRLGFTA